jgi:hypothetical protein
MGYLIYHPKRRVSNFGKVVVYHDSTTGNQDPYIWNQPFLHTYCHITQMSPEIGHINFWVSGDTFPNFTQLFCDLVFVVQEKVYWQECNTIDRHNPIVESEEAFNDHYGWAEQHHFQRRRRFTLKANPLQSFQPQTSENKLLDVLPVLVQMDLSVETLRKGMHAGTGSCPLRLDDDVTNALYTWLQRSASIKLGGDVLARIRKEHRELASPLPKAMPSLNAR